ncbi:hypothetical protein NCER_101699 [Vairimorpha ceranae BRL01]|uniref:Uncharacterized protein n=2 Tax=Vairimorpha ceranae TaxID=40302 RepID=C4VAK9_VAIC1|nr:hypothetical protein AAJ76_1670004897 [Vairimorpha ceranae]EEQ81743.1 hypothetical protein NCER_101699 [Vairimorpha ceranae BRL01]KKO73941.1 hypothetical protein AAJ76_1670004897 [Vairimorpha ceranae]
MLKVQENFCIFRIQGRLFRDKDLLKILIKKEPLVKGKILFLKKRRQKDTPFTKITVTKLQRKMLLNTVKSRSFKVFYNKRNKLGIPNHDIKETKEKIKLLSLDINHLSNKREELEVLLKKGKIKIMCLQET